MYPSGRLGQFGLIVVGAVVLGLVTGLGFVALTNRTPERDTALPDGGKVSISPSPSASPSATPSATPTAAATASATAAPSVTAAPTGSAAATAVATAVATSAAPTAGAVGSPAEPSLAARAPRGGFAVNTRLFGVHDANPVGAGWPNAPVASLRVWDAGATWRDIEPEDGRYDFAKLDAMVDTAEAKGADVLVVLGQTPSFHAVNAAAPSFYGPGASSMPRMSAWQRYVGAVAARYRGRPVIFQVWNEANVVGFWQGTPQQMALLTKGARDVLNVVNREAKLVAPALVTRLSGQRSWLNKFYAQRVGGRPVASYVDAVSVQLYPMATGKPEDSMALLGVNRAILARHGVNKPIWNTEVNYGMTGKPVAPLSGSRQAAYVARTYLLNAANGVQRVYWYGWETQSIVNTRMVRSDLSSLTSAGTAFATVADWMRGARINSCPVSANGTYVCTLTKTGTTRHVYWNPSRTVKVVTSGSATAYHPVDGSRQALRGGSTITVGPVPVLVT
jgi:hypothetical protein